MGQACAGAVVLAAAEEGRPTGFCGLEKKLGGCDWGVSVGWKVGSPANAVGEGSAPIPMQQCAGV